MTSDSRPTPSAPTPATTSTDESIEQPDSARAAALVRPRRTRQIVSILLILAGFVLLIITLRAQDLGLAPTEGASWTQITTGVLGTILLVTGLALIVQAFEVSDEPPSDD